MELSLASTKRVAIIIPFFNEMQRFSIQECQRLVQVKNICLFLVDDGSQDELSELIISELTSRFENISLIQLERNVGKAEALRHGILYACRSEFDYVAFFDADFSVHSNEIIEFIDASILANADFVFAVRDQNVSTGIVTSKYRKFQGRVFQVFANFILSSKFSDSQCGFKIFTSSSLNVPELQKPFLNRWLFDLEFLLRHKYLDPTVLEIPLKNWVHKKESKLKYFDAAIILSSLVRLRLIYGSLQSLKIIRR
jgi:dolichyl-phosphate beta-glucosyltransferase